MGTGYLSLASKQVDVFTSIGTLSPNTVARALNAADWTVAVFDLKSFYSNVVYTLRRTTLDTINNVDCETQSSNTGPDNVYQCSEKGDFVMIFDLNEAGSQNPKYLNMYQVMKISRENREAVQDMQIAFDSTKENDYQDGGPTNYARIYKFTPPAAPVSWVGQCSNRGICDGGSGICQCFPGYSGDDCSTMNALAQ